MNMTGNSGVSAQDLVGAWLGTTVTRSAILKGRRLELTTVKPVLFGDEYLTAAVLWERTRA